MDIDNNLVIPNHIGIIMDGNGRWATGRGLMRSIGHREGANNLKKLCHHMADVGVKYVSLYAFSTENFKRDKKEVDFLMNLFITLFSKEFKTIIDDNIKVVFSGRREPLPKKVLTAMDKISLETKNNTGCVLNICLNYGGQSEIVDMTKKLCTMYKNGKIDLDDIDVQFVQKNLYQDLPPLDLVIRTSGEMRVSNFMLYQSSYTEFYFTKTLFPDFNNEEFDKAILEFNKRTRKFGGVI